MIGVGLMLETENNTITKSSYRREHLMNEPCTHEIRKNLFGNINLLDLRRNWGCLKFIPYFRRENFDWSRASA